MKLDAKAVQAGMTRKGWKQVDLAKAVGTTRQAISHILQKEACTLKLLGRICQALGVTPNDILTNA